MEAGKQARLVNGWKAISPDKEWSEAARGDFQQRD